MSLITQIQSFASSVGADVKLLWTMINGKAADLSGLQTTAKSNLVAAINEVNTKAGQGGGASIDDGAASTTKVWSSSKTSTEISTAASGAATTGATNGANSAVSTIRNGVASTYDTLAKIATKIGTMDTAISNRIRFDAAQTLTAGQRTTVETNLNLGDTETNLAQSYITARDSA